MFLVVEKKDMQVECWCVASADDLDSIFTQSVKLTIRRRSIATAVHLTAILREANIEIFFPSRMHHGLELVNICIP